MQGRHCGLLPETLITKSPRSERRDYTGHGGFCSISYVLGIRSAEESRERIKSQCPVSDDGNSIQPGIETIPRVASFGKGSSEGPRVIRSVSYRVF